VYACSATILSAEKQAFARYFAMVNIGHNPTFENRKLSIEAHLLDFAGQLEGEIVAIYFYKRLRDEQKFAGVDQLVEQLRSDEAATRAFFAANPV
jgi:riboflavin kinase/FMN adenylyltransferase